MQNFMMSNQNDVTMKNFNFLRKFLLAGFLLLTGMAMSWVYGQDSLQVYYDGTSVNPVVDVTGHGYNLTREASNLQSVESGSGLGRYLSLPAANNSDYSCLSRGGGYDLPITNAFTIMAFINPGPRHGGVFNYSGFSLNTWDNGDGTTKFKCAMRIDNDSENDIWFELPDENNVKQGTWHHLAFTYDGDHVTIYVDGKMAMDSAYGSHTINIEKNNGRIAIGYGYTGQGSVFTGKLDEAMIFNKALTADQIKKASLIAAAGEDVTIGLGLTLDLDGSNSIGDIASYIWTLDGVTVGTKATISTDTLSAGDHEFVLVVSDGTNKASDTVKVTVAKVYAVPGEDVTVQEGEMVTLDGSNSVGEGLSYEWKLNGVVVGTTSSISTDTLSIGEHVFTLTVTDKDNESSSNDVKVTVEPVPVVANAGKDQAIVKGFMLTLDAGKSSGYQLTYQWRLNETDIGSTPLIQTDTLSVGKHVFALAVTDVHGTSSADTVYVTVEEDVPSLLDFETLKSDTSFLDVENGKEYLVFDQSNGPDKTNGDRLPDNGAQPVLEQGVKGKAMVFDGIKYWINMQYAYTKGGFNAKSYDYSTAIWFNANVTHLTPPKLPELVILDTPGFGLMIKDDTLYVTVYIRDRDNSSMPIAGKVIKKEFTKTNEWTHVAMVFDGGATATGDSSIFRVYLNGSLMAEDTLPVPNYYVDWYDWANVGATTGTWGSIESALGRPLSGSTSEGDMKCYFNGMIDELHAARTVWSADDVLALYHDFDVIAMAGDDQTVDMGTEVTLDGSASVGIGLTYSWTLDGVEVGDTSVITTDTLSKGEHTFVLEVTGLNAVSDKDTVLVTVEDNTGIFNRPQSTVRVYPNPTDGVVHVDLGELQGKATIEVLSLAGKQIVYRTMESTVTTLHLDDLDAGLYIIRVVTDKGAYTGKIQLNK